MKKLTVILIAVAMIIIGVNYKSFTQAKTAPFPELPINQQAVGIFIKKTDDMRVVNSLIGQYDKDGYKVVGLTSFQVDEAVMRVIVVFAKR